MKNPEFENIGFIKEYYIDNKFIGYAQINDSENRKMGYLGRAMEVQKEIVVLQNGKKIKPNTEVMTMIYPINGRFKKLTYGGNK